MLLLIACCKLSLPLFISLSLLSLLLLFVVHHSDYKWYKNGCNVPWMYLNVEVFNNNDPYTPKYVKMYRWKNHSGSNNNTHLFDINICNFISYQRNKDPYLIFLIVSWLSTLSHNWYEYPIINITCVSVCMKCTKLYTLHNRESFVCVCVWVYFCTSVLCFLHTKHPTATTIFLSPWNNERKLKSVKIFQVLLLFVVVVKGWKH